MNAETCVSYCDMTSMDSYYSPSAAQGREHQTGHFRTFPATDTKYSPAAFLSSKGQAYGEKSRSPFQQECQSLDAAAAGQGTFSKYHLFMQTSSCKTPPEDSKLHQESGHNGALIPCYGEWGVGGGMRVTEVNYVFSLNTEERNHHEHVGMCVTNRHLLCATPAIFHGWNVPRLSRVAHR